MNDSRDDRIAEIEADIARLDELVQTRVAKLEADNARLREMLELATERTIDRFRVFVSSEEEDVFTPVVRGKHNLPLPRPRYNTPTEALEAAYVEWKKGKSDD